ncbi:Glyco_hydro_17 domain-containing protein [Cephalotus follicularis]|uniref:glucan endo-1,3-beta-D-glucosidase n=1 Tax=Cephalotus follicularis TaxID=3775 RepID=A0A1Q3C4A1_CEPFO|nr:Glyco_hydro_17 domain-containing protein [Cephalotus follicularis]
MELNCASLIVLISVLVNVRMASSIAIGINYGQIANNLPSPEAVVPLVKSIGATKLKLYDADGRVLRAFANTGVEFIVGLGNEYLQKMREPNNAQTWVKQNVQAYLPATKITCITIGNEVLTLNGSASTLVDHLLPTMESIHAALVSLNLDKQVIVTTAHSLAVLETSYPPSAGTFRKDLVGCITPILNFHAKTGSPFLINAYPYFAYKANPKQIPLDFVLFQPNQGVVDPLTNLRYTNMLYAQIDAVYAALSSVGYKNLSLQISETGWPSKGDADEAGATLDNAKKYNGNLMKVIAQNKGTPMRPGYCDFNIYVFALFNENMKPGPTSERNYGLFKPDGTPAYQLIGITMPPPTNTSAAPTAGAGSPTPAASSSGYLSISSSAAAGAVKERYNRFMGPVLSVFLFLIKFIL